MKIVSRKIRTREELIAAFEIRKKVFVEEQSVSPDIEYDEFENSSTHFLVLDEITHQPLGTARWRFTPKGIKLERFAVLAEARNQNVGKLLMQEVISDLPYIKGDMYLHAQLQVIPFYEKFGFVAKEPEFEEANIKHKKMIYTAP